MKLHSIVIGVVVALGSTAPAHAGLLGGGSLGGSFAGGLTGTIDRPHGTQSAGTVAGDLQASRMAKPTKEPNPGTTRKPSPGPAANTAVVGEGAARATRSTAVDGNLAQQVEGTVDSSHAAASTRGSDALSLTRTEARKTPQPASTTAPSSSGGPTAKRPVRAATPASPSTSAPSAGVAPPPPRNELSASGSASTATSASIGR